MNTQSGSRFNKNKIVWAIIRMAPGSSLTWPNSRTCSRMRKTIQPRPGTTPCWLLSTRLRNSQRRSGPMETLTSSQKMKSIATPVPKSSLKRKKPNLFHHQNPRKRRPKKPPKKTQNQLAVPKLIKRIKKLPRRRKRQRRMLRKQSKRLRLGKLKSSHLPSPRWKIWRRRLKNLTLAKPRRRSTEWDPTTVSWFRLKWKARDSFSKLTQSTNMLPELPVSTMCIFKNSWTKKYQWMTHRKSYNFGTTIVRERPSFQENIQPRDSSKASTRTSSFSNTKVSRTRFGHLILTTKCGSMISPNTLWPSKRNLLKMVATL